MSEIQKVILFCFGRAVYEATCKGKFGPGGCSEWRDAQAVLFVAKNHLYGDGSMYLR